MLWTLFFIIYIYLFFILILKKQKYNISDNNKDNNKHLNQLILIALLCLDSFLSKALRQALFVSVCSFVSILLPDKVIKATAPSCALKGATTFDQITFVRNNWAS